LANALTNKKRFFLLARKIHKNSLTGFIPLDSKHLAGFTLLELITVVIIVAILVAISVPQYLKTVERSYDKEAIANLKLIKAAQKIYKLEYLVYYGAPNQDLINLINLNLRLDLNESVWDYYIVSGGVGQNNFFYAYARRYPPYKNPPEDYGRRWGISQALDEPICAPMGGGGPNACP